MTYYADNFTLARECTEYHYHINDDWVILEAVDENNQPCPCGNPKPWLTLEGRTEDILTFENGTKIAPLSLYAILKEIHRINRFQLIQSENNTLELRLLADDKHKTFLEAKNKLEEYLCKHGIQAEVLLSEEEPKANPVSGKYQHVIARGCG